MAQNVGPVARVRLPTADESQLPSARSGAIIAQYDTSAVGEAMASMGANVAKVGMALADNWDKVNETGVAAKWLNMQFEEDKAYDAATRDLKPEQAAGFTDRHLAGFKARAETFWNALPDKLKPEYQERILLQRNKLWQSGVAFERQAQNLAALSIEDQAISGPIMGRLTSVAASAVTDYDKLALLREIDGEVDALVEQNPGRTAIEREKRRRDVRAQLYTAFANALPPQAKWTLAPENGAQTVGERLTIVPGIASPFEDDATWGAALSRYRPDLLTGRTKQDVLDLRTDPVLVADLADKLAQDGGKYLAARGHQATPTNQFLAYVLGDVGAADFLGAEGIDYADAVDPDAAAANPAMFYKPGADGKPDPNQPRTVAEVRAWAGQAMAGTAHVDWGRELADGLTYQQRAAFSGDASRRMIDDRDRATKAARERYDYQYKNLELRIEGGFAGEADILAAWDMGRGWLRDENDRLKLINLYNKKRADGVNLGMAWQRFNGRHLDGYSTKDKSDANLVYTKGMGGADGLLDDPPGAATGMLDEQRGTKPTKAEELFSFIERANMVPDDAVAELKRGMDAPDAATMGKAFVIMDAMRRRNRVVVENAFKPEDIQRLDLYQELAPRLPAEELMQELSAHVSPQVAKDRAELRKEGEALAAINGPNDAAYVSSDEIVKLLGGSSLIADPTMFKALRRDFETNFGIAYSRTRNVDSAKTLATRWMQMKWNKTEIGSDVTVMPYPPERYYPPIDGDHSWMDDQLEKFVTAQVPDNDGFWLVEDPTQTSGDVAAGRYPRYMVGVMGGDGIYRILGATNSDPRPVLIDFNPERAKAERRAAFEAARRKAAAPPTGILAPGPASDPAYGDFKGSPNNPMGRQTGPVPMPDLPLRP